MAADALVVLGRPEAVLPWVERYRKSFDGHPAGGNPIAPEQWREALGDYRRVGDWIAFFARSLEERPWRAVLSDWCDRLASGISAAAFHGVIRTAHAARSLSRRETPGRRRELAEGLGYWAASYQTLPETSSPTPEPRLPSEAIRRVELLPNELRRHGFITDRLLPLGDLPSFARVADMVDTSCDASLFLSDLAETFAGLYLAHANEATTIALVHAVTGPGAVRLLLPHLSREVTRKMLRYGWQAAAAIYAASASAEPNRAARQPPLSVEEIIDRAVESGDEHGFKFAEACLREHAIAPRPVFLAAALDATRRLGRGW